MSPVESHAPFGHFIMKIMVFPLFIKQIDFNINFLLVANNSKVKYHEESNLVSVGLLWQL